MVTVRRGLPRTAGGEPWPLVPGPQLEAARTAAPAPESRPATPLNAALPPRSGAQPLTTSALRRGLPRAPGGDPWPPESAVAEGALLAEPTRGLSAEPVALADPVAADPVVLEEAVDPSAPARPGSRPRAPIPRVAAAAVGLVAAAGVTVLAARGVTTLPGVPEFLARYPGEYEPGVPTDPGFPAWARWSHFLNFFFMVLIVRTGLLVRRQQKPPAYVTPRRGGNKVSVFLWLHTGLDLLWLANGVAFVVMLVVSGHWARIVPTSVDVVPHAVSALLQYLTLGWPVENGWVNYNALQQLMYFVVVFVAAPVAALTGLRMSAWWPERARTLNRVFPAAAARALHFPTMLFFVVFVVIHVFLVLSTGALKNLNHMFAGTDAVTWAGFAWFAAGLLVTAATLWAAKPLVLAPIASLFGRVSER